MPTRRRAGGRRRAGRLRELMVAGLVDSFGLSLGWTVFTLIAVSRGGLGAAALYNAAMLTGVVLSAPVTAWLARRLDGRVLLRAAAGTEMVLRVATLAALVAGWPPSLVAAGVVAMHVAGWAGFAAMRAEVSAVDDRPRAMTRYALCIAAVEAAGVGIAALLPLDTRALGTLHVVVTLGYAASLLPTLASARRARVTRAGTPGVAASGAATAGVAVEAEAVATADGAGRPRLPVGALAGGAAVMLLASGPTLLSVALATELHGQVSVAGAALAFSVGCLLSSVAVDAVGRLRLPDAFGWPLWGIGMLIGWVAAPWHVAGLMLAQFLAGMSMTALEGGMDARVAQRAPAGGATTVLAWSAATRALGSAVAVRALPWLVAAPAVGQASGVAVAVLAVAGLCCVAAWTRRRPAPRHARRNVVVLPARVASIPPADVVG